MFDKTILPSFLGGHKSTETTAVPPARPPMRPTAESVNGAQAPQNTTNQVPPVVPNPTPAGIPNQVPPVMPNPAAAGISNQVPPVVPNPTPAGVPNQVPPVVPNPTPAGVPNQVPPVVPNPAPACVPNQVPPVMPNPAPAGIPNQVPPVPNPAPAGIPNQVPPVPNPAPAGVPNQEPSKSPVVHQSVISSAKKSEVRVFSNEADQVAGKDGIIHGNNLHDTRFADIWFTPENIAYVRDIRTRFALTPLETPDLPEFHQALEQGFTGSSSYSIRFAGDAYRVERVLTSDGIQFNCRKMPTETPEIESLGFADPIIKHLSSLGRSSGLLLFAGPTGQGKTTSASAIMKRFLDTEGGFLYTIEDPPEMPLAGLYHAQNGGLGLCKQTAVENDQWGTSLRSALRSKPRYILVGEIRTPETASMCLVAATSGHLVLSTIHANGVEDALNSLIKYAASTGLAETLVSDLLARGILGVIYQRLEGVEKLQLHYETAFANPNTSAADQMRMAIRDGSINLATFMETQATRMSRGLPMFKEQ